MKSIGEETFRRGLQRWIKSIALISQDKNIKWNDQNQISYSKIEMIIKNGPRKKNVSVLFTNLLEFSETDRTGQNELGFRPRWNV